jgi:hypothetical protein
MRGFLVECCCIFICTTSTGAPPVGACVEACCHNHHLVDAMLRDGLLHVLVKPLGARVHKVDHTCTASEASKPAIV